MKPKLMLWLTLVWMGGSCGICMAAIVYPKAPDGGRQIVSENIGTATNELQIAVSLDESNGVLHCCILNSGTNALAYNDFDVGNSENIGLEIRHGSNWLRASAMVFPMEGGGRDR